MQVLKFGGTSVSSSENILKVVDIVSAAVDRDTTIVVCSAISGCTDELIAIGEQASRRDEAYKERIAALQDRHEQIIKEILPLE